MNFYIFENIYFYMFLKSIIPQIIKKIILSNINIQTEDFSSQSGEDMILRNLFYRDYLEKNNPGFYVDIGAYHPKFYIFITIEQWDQL